MTLKKLIKESDTIQSIDPKIQLENSSTFVLNSVSQIQNFSGSNPIKYVPKSYQIQISNFLSRQQAMKKGYKSLSRLDLSYFGDFISEQKILQLLKRSKFAKSVILSNTTTKKQLNLIKLCSNYVQNLQISLQDEPELEVFETSFEKITPEKEEILASEENFIIDENDTRVVPPKQLNPWIILKRFNHLKGFYVQIKSEESIDWTLESYRNLSNSWSFFKKLETFKFKNQIFGMNELFLQELTRFLPKLTCLKTLNLTLPSIETFQVSHQTEDKNVPLTIQPFKAISDIINQLDQLEYINLNIDGSGLDGNDISNLVSAFRSRQNLKRSVLEIRNGYLNENIIKFNEVPNLHLSFKNEIFEFKAHGLKALKSIQVPVRLQISENSTPHLSNKTFVQALFHCFSRIKNLESFEWHESIWNRASENADRQLLFSGLSYLFQNNSSNLQKISLRIADNEMLAKLLLDIGLRLRDMPKLSHLSLELSNLNSQKSESLKPLLTLLKCMNEAPQLGSFSLNLPNSNLNQEFFQTAASNISRTIKLKYLSLQSIRVPCIQTLSDINTKLSRLRNLEEVFLRFDPPLIQEQDNNFGIEDTTILESLERTLQKLGKSLKIVDIRLPVLVEEEKLIEMQTDAAKINPQILINIETDALAYLNIL